MEKPVLGVIGIGEVGKAIAKIFKKNFIVLKKDLNFDEIGKNSINILHICIPYTKDFLKIITREIKILKPQLVIIHSTVLPTTTKKIFQKTNVPIVHSPVMGTHPNLAEDILRFTKFIGPVEENAGKLARQHLESVGIKVEVLGSSLETEVGKLLDTTYYGWNIIFAKIVGQICEKLNIDFSKVYTKFNEAYNEGYKKTRPNVTRPILKYEKGPVGGHCITPNAEILHQFSPSPLTSFLIKTNKKL